MRKLWGRVDTIIYPPINVPIQAFTEPQNDRKDDWVVSIGVLQPNKCFGELIQAFAHTSRGKLAIIGHRRDQGYFRWLLKKTIRRDLRHRVRILTDLSDIEKWRLIRRSKVISHQKRFEPFGIAVAEGMYAGAVPIVFKGCTSGPWIDIVDKGEYGFGYEDVGELTSYIDLILSEPDLQNKYAAKSKERARMFTYKNFKQQWMDVLKKL
jgi:glycosyltransferase involved in cell wall biosynthesis